MPGIFQPIGNVKLTDVAVIRLKKGGRRYEVATYRNKINEFRKNLENDLDNVLQTQEVFSNVSRGEIARREDLKKSFGTDDIEKIIIEILNKGEIQLGKEERTKELESKFHEVASIISRECINTETKKPHPTTIIIKAMRASHISIDLSKNSKRLAVDVFRKLKDSGIIPIARVQMSVCINADSTYLPDIHESIKNLVQNISENFDIQGAKSGYACTVDPGNFRELAQIIKIITDNTGSLSIMSTNSTEHFGGDMKFSENPG